MLFYCCLELKLRNLATHPDCTYILHGTTQMGGTWRRKLTLSVNIKMSTSLNYLNPPLAAPGSTLQQDHKNILCI